MGITPGSSIAGNLVTFDSSGTGFSATAPSGGIVKAIHDEQHRMIGKQWTTQDITSIGTTWTSGQFSKLHWRWTMANRSTIGSNFKSVGLLLRRGVARGNQFVRISKWVSKTSSKLKQQLGHQHDEMLTVKIRRWW